MVDSQTRQELNALSKEVFGASSRWQKLVTNGYSELVTEEVEELVPSDKEGEEPKLEKVRMPALLNGMRQSVMKRHTVESVKELMLKLKTSRDEYFVRVKEAQAAQQAAKEKAELAQKVQEAVAGSAAK